MTAADYSTAARRFRFEADGGFDILAKRGPHGFFNFHDVRPDKCVKHESDLPCGRIEAVITTRFPIALDLLRERRQVLSYEMSQQICSNCAGADKCLDIARRSDPDRQRRLNRF